MQITYIVRYKLEDVKEDVKIEFYCHNVTSTLNTPTTVKMQNMDTFFVI